MRVVSQLVDHGSGECLPIQARGEVLAFPAKNDKPDVIGHRSPNLGKLIPHLGGLCVAHVGTSEADGRAITFNGDDDVRGLFRTCVHGNLLQANSTKSM